MTREILSKVPALKPRLSNIVRGDRGKRYEALMMQSFAHMQSRDPKAA